MDEKCIAAALKRTTPANKQKKTARGRYGTENSAAAKKKL